MLIDDLEEESINLIRSLFQNNNASDIWSFYSIGKDSSCILRLLQKAFYPKPIPCNFLHIDTGWKFKEMYEFRDKIAKTINLYIYKHPQCLTPDQPQYTDIMKTEALKNAIDKFKIKIAIGGSRREEEKSRAKEKMISLRYNHKWNSRKQNPEISNLWNTTIPTSGSLRVFPLSNWTEINIWQYIKKENIEVVPLYFSHYRKTIIKNNQIFIDEKSNEGEYRNIRFRTLGCYPLTAAIESKVNTVDDIIKELEESNDSERIGRLIDRDTEFSMERKKENGYF